MSGFASVKAAVLIAVPMTKVLFESFCVSCFHICRMAVQMIVFPFLKHHVMCTGHSGPGALPSTGDRALGAVLEREVHLPGTCPQNDKRDPITQANNLRPSGNHKRGSGEIKQKIRDMRKNVILLL